MTAKKKEYFFFSSTFKNFLFEGLHIDGTSGIVGVCLVTCALTILLEASKTLAVFFSARKKQNPLTYGQSDSNIQDRSPLFASIMIPANIAQIRWRRLRYHCLGYLVHVFNVTLAYFIMLAVMSYDAWIFLSVIIGTGLGYFLFGGITAIIQQRYNSLKVVQYDQEVEFTVSDVGSVS